jgi:hypothetical protein
MRARKQQIDSIKMRTRDLRESVRRMYRAKPSIVALVVQLLVDLFSRSLQPALIKGCH